VRDDRQVHGHGSRLGQWHGSRIRGQTARALLALVEAGERGVTALECSTWAYRLAADCYDLRRDHGLAIRCDREEHPGGWHGRHVLETPVEIVSVQDGGELAA
jgi:Winged helix domain